MIAYGELWIDPDEKEVELARIIVAPSERGRGLGRLLVKQLASLATDHYSDVFMRVHPDNAAALHAYGSAGFRRVATAQEDAWNEIQPVRYVWLALPKSRQRRT